MNQLSVRQLRGRQPKLFLKYRHWQKEWEVQDFAKETLHTIMLQIQPVINCNLIYAQSLRSSLKRGANITLLLTYAPPQNSSGELGTKPRAPESQRGSSQGQLVRDQGQSKFLRCIRQGRFQSKAPTLHVNGETAHPHLPTGLPLAVLAQGLIDQVLQATLVEGWQIRKPAIRHR